MSNPLTILRTQGKTLLAVFAALLMFGFLIEGVFVSSARKDGRQSVNSVVSVAGKDIDELELSSIHRADIAANGLIELVTQAAQAKKRTPRPFPQVNFAQNEAMLVNKLVFARKAHHFGVSLSDNDVDELLKEMADGAVTQVDLEKLCQQALSGVNNSVTKKQLYAQLRTTILSQQFMVMLSGGSMMDMQISPAQAWFYFRQANRRVRLELLPLKVPAFVDDVKETPTEAQLKDLHTKYKEFSPNPQSPEPGFATPHKLQFSYVKFDFQAFQDRAREAISEQQLKDEYARRIDQGEFVVKDLPGENEGKAVEPPPGKDAAGKKESTPAAPADEKKAEDKLADPASAAPASDEQKTEKDKVPALSPSSEKKPSDSKNFDVEDELKNSEDPAKSADKPADDTQKPAAEATPAAGSEAKEKTSAEGQPAAESSEKTRVKTFEEVRDDLLRSLSQQPAQEAFTAATRALAEALQTLEQDHRNWEQDNKSKPADKQSKRPVTSDYVRDVLAQHKLELKTLPMLDQYELAEEELGQSFFIDQRGQTPITERYRFIGGMYVAETAKSFLPGVDFFFWREAEEVPRTLEFKDARDDVVKAWKIQQAYELARSRARELSGKAKGKTLREAFPEGVERAEAIVETDPFSWLSRGVLPTNAMQYELSTIKQVKYPSPEFMETMYRLRPGDCDIAADQPRRLVYVMRIIEEMPPEDDLRQQFLSQGIMFNPPIFSQYQSLRTAYIRSIMGDLERDFKVTWYREAQPFR